MKIVSRHVDKELNQEKTDCLLDEADKEFVTHPLTENILTVRWKLKEDSVRSNTRENQCG